MLKVFHRHGYDWYPQRSALRRESGNTKASSTLSLHRGCRRKTWTRSPAFRQRPAFAYIILNRLPKPASKLASSRRCDVACRATMKVPPALSLRLRPSCAKKIPSPLPPVAPRASTRGREAPRTLIKAVVKATQRHGEFFFEKCLRCTVLLRLPGLSTQPTVWEVSADAFVRPACFAFLFCFSVCRGLPPRRQPKNRQRQKFPETRAGLC